MSAWPSLDNARLADAVAALAEGVAAWDQRAQLHALAALVRNIGSEHAQGDTRAELERAIDGALAAGDEKRAVRAARELAALDRAAVAPVDWSAASGG